MKRDFCQNQWDQAVEDDLRKLMEIAVSEDINGIGDLTSQSLIPRGMKGRAAIHVRTEGVIAGMQAVPICVEHIDPELKWFPKCKDGQFVAAGSKLGEVVGPVLSMLTAERLLLNLLGHLCGVATLTKRFVDKVEGTGVKIYDTRKTTLGWRRMEKYAVRCGGGTNHRTGLFDAILIKDNHLAFGALPGHVLDSDHTEDLQEVDESNITHHRTGLFSPGESVNRARTYLIKLMEEKKAQGIQNFFPGDQIPLIEIEIDTLDQFENALSGNPDLVLLDNMTVETMLEAVQRRNQAGSQAELEASGGITLDVVRAVAETGVERISVGSLTHSNFSLDIGMDWEG